MANRKEGRHVKDSSNNLIIDLLKVYRGQYVTIEELMAFTELGKHALLGALRGMREGDRWILRYKHTKTEHPALISVALFIDRSEVIRDPIYNPACWPVPKSLQTRAV
jgi:hypothetical protein